MPSNTTTLTPAHRAWITRRQSSDPSASARKAWDTRRAKHARASHAIASPEAIAAYLDRPTRTVISIRVDDRVLAALRAEAERRGVGYQTLIHDVLTSAAIEFGGRS